MTISKYQMIARFLDGEESGKASREKIAVLDGVPTIVGYGWAVYAADLGDRYALFGDGYKTTGTNVGWAGYSGTTTGHLQEIKGAFEENDEEYVVVGARPEVREVLDGDVDLAALAEEEQVEKRETTGYLYRQ